MRIRSSEDDSDDYNDLSLVLDRTDNDDSFSTTFTSGDSIMATKKPASAPVAAAPAAAPVAAAPAKKTKAAAAPAPVAEPAAETAGPRAVPEGHTGISTLAEELGTTPGAMRRKLRATEGFAKPEGQSGYWWKDGSKELAAVKALFTPEPEAAAAK